MSQGSKLFSTHWLVDCMILTWRSRGLFLQWMEQHHGKAAQTVYSSPWLCVKWAKCPEFTSPGNFGCPYPISLGSDSQTKFLLDPLFFLLLSLCFSHLRNCDLHSGIWSRDKAATLRASAKVEVQFDSLGLLLGSSSSCYQHCGRWHLLWFTVEEDRWCI